MERVEVDTWLIVGHRRWARVMAAELCAMLPAEVRIEILADAHEDEFGQWLGASGLASRIQVVGNAQRCATGQTGVALIVNSAHQHRSAIEAALAAGYHVVSEKPMGFSAEETRRLIDDANARGLALFCTNTYLFASYLEVLRGRWLHGRHIAHMHLTWQDRELEARHGATKSYDSSVPLIFDVLPHVANIVLATLGPREFSAESLQVLHGGSDVSILYRASDVDLHVRMVRNADSRVRQLHYMGTDLDLSLDFAVEPGMVSAGMAPPVSIDDDWQRKPRPIAAMLASVIDFFVTGRRDIRLDTCAALFGNSLIDSVVERYAEGQAEFLGHAAADDEARRYAHKEARALAERAAPHLASRSPLRRIAAATPSLPVQSHREPSSC